MAINCASLCVLSNIYNIPKRCSNQENACSRDHPLLRFLSSYGSSISRLSLSRLQATNANPCNKLRNLGDFYLPRKKVDVTSSNFDTLPRRRESLPPQDAPATNSFTFSMIFHFQETIAPSRCLRGNHLSCHVSRRFHILSGQVIFRNRKIVRFPIALPCSRYIWESGRFPDADR